MKSGRRRGSCEESELLVSCTEYKTQQELVWVQRQDRIELNNKSQSSELGNGCTLKWFSKSLKRVSCLIGVIR